MLFSVTPDKKNNRQDAPVTYVIGKEEIHLICTSQHRPGIFPNSDLSATL